MPGLLLCWRRPGMCWAWQRGSNKPCSPCLGHILVCFLSPCVLVFSSKKRLFFFSNSPVLVCLYLVSWILPMRASSLSSFSVSITPPFSFPQSLFFFLAFCFMSLFGVAATKKKKDKPLSLSTATHPTGKDRHGSRQLSNGLLDLEQVKKKGWGQRRRRERGEGVKRREERSLYTEKERCVLRDGNERERRRRREERGDVVPLVAFQ